MARKTTTSLELENQKLREELAKLREAVDVESSAAAAYKGRLALSSSADTPWSHLMVGIRNVSDYTVGIPPILPGDSPIQLAPSFNGDEPGAVAVITYAAWRELRKGHLVERGMVCRDDSVLGTAFIPAPEDRPGEVAPGQAVNMIDDPHAWIERRDEAQLRTDIAKITSQASLFRLRRVVDEALRKFELESELPRDTREQQARVAQQALNALSAKLRMVDDLTTTMIEARTRTDANVDSSGRRISIKI